MLSSSTGHCSSMSGSDDLLTRVKENLKVLGGSDTTDRNVQDVISNVRHAGQKVLLQNPRRGVCTSTCNEAASDCCCIS